MNYSPERLMLAAQTFRKLADTYSELTEEHKDNREYKTAIILQLNEMAGMLERYYGSSTIDMDMDRERKKEIIRKLRTKGMVVSRLTLLKRDERREELIIAGNMAKGMCITINELARVLSELLGSRFVPVDNHSVVVNQTENEYYFVRAPRFAARCEVAMRNKGKNTVCGDKFAYLNKSFGKEIMCLADGMGSGIRANKDSGNVVELLDTFLEAGFSENSAIRLINTAYSINDYEGNPITLDLCVMDMYLGVCNFIKLGAVSTFIKRRGWVEVIKSTTLPIGVLENVDFDNAIKKLYEGDYIIMMSDGVLDSFDGQDKERAVMNLIADVDKEDPKELASYILDKALEKSAGNAPDDCTVAVAVIVSNENFTNQKI